jgi:hypothetical protein
MKLFVEYYEAVYFRCLFPCPIKDSKIIFLSRQNPTRLVFDAPLKSDKDIPKKLIKEIL